MLKKFGCSLVVVGALTLGVGVLNSVLVGSVMAEEKKCAKCGHLPSECAKTSCKCECQKKTH